MVISQKEWDFVKKDWEDRLTTSRKATPEVRFSVMSLKSGQPITSDVWMPDATGYDDSDRSLVSDSKRCWDFWQEFQSHRAIDGHCCWDRRLWVEMCTRPDAEYQHKLSTV